MVQNNSKMTVFDCQVHACEEFFQKKLPCGEFKLIEEKDRLDNMEQCGKGPIFDVTGFDAQQQMSAL